MAFLDSVMVTIRTAEARAERFEATAAERRKQGRLEAAAYYDARALYARAEVEAMVEAVTGL